MKMAMWLDYKPTRYEGKGFLRNLNIRIHRDITGEMWFGVDAVYKQDSSVKSLFIQFLSQVPFTMRLVTSSENTIFKLYI